MVRSIRRIVGVGLIALVSACASPQPIAPTTGASSAVVQPAAPVANGRLGGIVRGVDQGEVALQDGEHFTLGSDAPIIRSVRVEAPSFHPGDFVAVTAKRQDDNTLLASVVNIFPESMRGLGVGQRPMDGGNLMTNATISDVPVNLMTNATIDDVASAGFTVSFPDGSDTVALSQDAQVNRFETAAVADLVPGTPITAFVNNGSAQFITIM